MLYAIDTSGLLLLLKKNESYINKFSEKYKTDKILIPPYVFFEILRGYEYKKATKQIKNFEDFFSITYQPEIKEFDVMRRASKLYAERRLKGLSIQDGDILIAAWCLECEAILVTDNVKHFKDIEGLQLENWKQH
jgi:predicted nucleic acid-binding protein